MAKKPTKTESGGALADAEKAAQDAASKVDVQADEQRGVGGAYVFDPKTGKRKRIAGPRVTLSTGEISDPTEETAAAQTTDEPNTETGGIQ